MEGFPAENAWRRFCRRHAALIRVAAAEDPAFWRDLAETVAELQPDSGPTRPRVEELRDVATQTDVRHLVPVTWYDLDAVRRTGGNSAGEAAGVEAVAEVEEAAEKETGTGAPGTAGEEGVAEAAEAVGAVEEDTPLVEEPVAGSSGPPPLMALCIAEPREPVRVPPPRKQQGCWNCGGGHRYADCPRPRRSRFCYGCGAEGTTLADCPRCAPMYQLEGAYPGFRGPRDRSRPAPAGAEPSGRRLRREPSDSGDSDEDHFTEFPEIV